MTIISKKLLLQVVTSDVTDNQKKMLLQQFSVMNQATLLKVYTHVAHDKSFLVKTCNIIENVSKKNKLSSNDVITTIEKELQNVHDTA